MNYEALRKHFKKLQKIIISYEKLMEMSDDSCVRVNITYFNYLIARIQMLGIEDKKCWDIFYKYIELDNIQRYVNSVNFVRTTYYLMSVKEIKYLVKTLDDVPWYNTVFLESKVKSDELEKRHKDLKRRYNEKVNELSSKDRRIISFNKKGK